MPGNKLNKTTKTNTEGNIQKSKKIKSGVNVIKHQRNFLQGFNDCGENLNKSLFESFSG